MKILIALLLLIPTLAFGAVGDTEEDIKNTIRVKEPPAEYLLVCSASDQTKGHQGYVNENSKVICYKDIGKTKKTYYYSGTVKQLYSKGWKITHIVPLQYDEKFFNHYIYYFEKK